MAEDGNSNQISRRAKRGKMAAVHLDDDDDEEFLSLLAFAEANAHSRVNTAATTNKRRMIHGGDEVKYQPPPKKMIVAVDSAPKKTKEEEEEEGAYMAALRGSKSVAWQQNPLNRSISRPNATVAAAHFNGGGGFNRSGERQQPSVSEKDCPCGQGACVVFTANTERNRGRQFYRCPLRQENGGCGFFEWCDSASGNNNSRVSYSVLPCPPRVSTTSTSKSSNVVGYGARTESSCFKCSKPGHWAKDCPASSSSDSPAAAAAASFGGGRRPVSSSSSSDCFKCGTPGHWAKDCPVSSSSDSPAAAAAAAAASFGGGRRPVSSPSSSDCFKCGTPGHWARDCTSSQSTGATRRF